MPQHAQLVVGTAGHIDHGKSRLVWSLTGTNPDRLPEEQARGMTIDLGFAHATIDDCDVFFVDVPGHERFVRNMVAGATGIDVALMVVAADDSIMPQTREHAELLSLLGIEACVLVLTKCDLVDADWAEAVADEAAGLLAGLHIQPCAIVHTSAVSGSGLDQLKAVLAKLARERAATKSSYSWFRLPIDRAFTVPGRGTVVTGSVAHGAVRTDDELELFPGALKIRVRDLQSHSAQRGEADGRMRLACNLAGVSRDEVRRGHELATPGYLFDTTRMDVRLASLRMPGKLRRRDLRVRLHIATSEVAATCRLLDEPADATVRGVIAQIRTYEPIAASWGQRFILRDDSGSRTLGGGVVLRPAAATWTAARPPDVALLDALTATDPRQRTEAAIRSFGWNTPGNAHLATNAGIADAAAIAPIVRQLGVEGRIVTLSDREASMVFHADVMRDARERLAKKLTAHLAANPRAAGLPRGEWPGWMPRACPVRWRANLAEWLIARGHFVDSGGFVLPKGHAAALSSDDQRLLADIEQQFLAAAFQPPELESLPQAAGKHAKRVRELVDLATVRGRLMKIADGLWLHTDHHAAMRTMVAQAIRSRGPITVADIRTLLNSTRKYVVPLAEHLDQIGITRRTGDTRALGPKADP
ncbi:MAG: selenocysteine-specific translation elongation factor [Phycisphaerae bacterium]